jgi:hypothetical protein
LFLFFSSCFLFSTACVRALGAPQGLLVTARRRRRQWMRRRARNRSTNDGDADGDGDGDNDDDDDDDDDDDGDDDDDSGDDIKCDDAFDTGNGNGIGNGNSNGNDATGGVDVAPLRVRVVVVDSVAFPFRRGFADDYALRSRLVSRGLFSTNFLCLMSYGARVICLVCVAIPPRLRRRLCSAITSSRSGLLTFCCFYIVKSSRLLSFAGIPPRLGR